MAKTIYIIGVGGRTGAMFARELQGACDIVGVGKQSEIEMIAWGGLRIERGTNPNEALKVEAIAAEDFGRCVETKVPDYIWLAVRNPVTEAVKSYYRVFRGKERIPVLILSQNGLSAIDDAKAALREVLGQDADRVDIVRVSLMNGIDAKSEGRTFDISYKLPVKLGFGLWGDKEPQDRVKITEVIEPLATVFGTAGFKTQEFDGKDAAKMENSKLFTNLIGMAAAVSGMAADDGLREGDVFKLEISMLREYVLAVRANGGGFAANFCGYPIGFLAGFVFLPFWVLVPMRGILAQIVAKGRNRPKELNEVDYYNGEVARLGRSGNIKTPVNDELILSAKRLLP